VRRVEPQTLTAKERVGRGLDILAVGLRPFVDEHMGANAPAGKDWLELLEARDEQRTGQPRRYSADDPRFLLRVLTEEWRAFGRAMPRHLQAFASELRETGNRWAHSPSLSEDDADRALDTMARLLRAVGAVDASENVSELSKPRVAPGAGRHAAPTAQVDGELPDAPGGRPGSGPAGDGMHYATAPTGGQMERTELRAGALTVTLEHSRAVNYALAHNGVSPLQGLTFENHGSQPVEVRSVELRLESPVADVAPTLALPGIVVPPGAAVSAPQAALRWPMNPAAFASLDEAVGAQLHLAVHTAERRWHAEQSLLLLARDEWWARAIPESLAAFVRPRDAAIARLLSEASDLLAARTGDPALPGYQAGADRALAMAEAIYDAMGARQIRYIDPPPSFEGTGQKIRGHSEVLDGRWGTCLDLAVAYAAALEGAGLNPVLAVYRGHAFAGVLLDDMQLGEVVLTDRNTVVNLVDSKLLLAVETTCLTAGPNQGGLADAHRAAAARFTRGLDDFENLVDVRAAHRRVRPLPTVAVGAAGTTVTVEQSAPTITAPRIPAPVAAPVPTAGTPRTQEFPPRVAQWRNSLLDLSFRNPLLNMRTSRSGLDLHVPAGSLGALEDMVAAGRAITLLPSDQLDEIHRAQGSRYAQDIDPETLARLLHEESALFSSVTTAGYPARLRGLVRKAKTIVEETGANNLFLALGSMVWEDAGREARAPLFLLPVTLKVRPGRPYQLQIDDGAYAIPNQCLLEKLRVSKGLVVPAFDTPELDESGIDLAGSLQQIRIALLQAQLAYRVEETAHVAVLQFSTLQLWQDLGENWAQFMANPVVRHLVETPTDSFDDPVAEPPVVASAEAEAYLPVPVDGSQLQAVLWGAAGRSFVLEGPPGTGKSQTITNLIAHSLAEGRRVLFVAEKQAALDVVRRRLDAVGLAPFSLDLHGRTQTPGAVREQLRAALNLASSSNPSSWEALRSTYRGLVSNLARYPRALHDEGPAGLAAWTARQAILTLDGDFGTPTPDVPAAVVSGSADVQSLYAIARDLTGALYDLGTVPSRHVWSVAAPDVDAAALLVAVDEVLASDADVPADLRALVDAAVEVRDLRDVEAWLRHVAVGSAVPSTWAGVVDDPSWAPRAAEAQHALGQHRGAAAPSMAVVAPTALALDLDGLLAASRAADGKMFKKKPRLDVLSRLAPHLRPSAQLQPASLTTTLEQLVALRAVTAQLEAFLASVPAVRLPSGWGSLEPDAPERYAALIDGVRASHRVVSRFPGAVPITDRLVTTGVPVQAADAVGRLAAAWETLAGALRVPEAEFARWCGGRPLVERHRTLLLPWQADLRSGGQQLGRWRLVAKLLGTLRSGGLELYAAGVHDGRVPAEDAERVLRLAIAHAALQERLSAAGLDSFDPVQRERAVETYLRTGADVRAQMVAELPARIVAARSFTSTRLVGRVGELSRELTRKRGGLSIRSLMREYGSVIAELTPVLLMSPHSVARFLPPGAVDVDIVVYDEASQIRVAEAVGAMGRGRATIIVGDSQQMPPSSFGGDAESDEDATQATAPTGLVPRDEESILSEAVASNLPRLWLSWHYRSQDESLIAFSNRYYYEGRLASFPGPPETRDGFGLRWRRVQGTFERGRERVNRVEAAAVVAEIEQRLRAEPATSIGVVTFNTEQRDLILDLLEASHEPAVATALAAADDPVFVKNLENVQGDERDVILFTLAFSPDPVTGKLPLNFGPLNRGGGERRLNVAVTRARRQVVLFSSFDPEHIELERTGARGLHHLRDYLMLAARGTETLAAMQPAAVHDLHRQQVARALAAAGLEVREQVGLSDFTVDIAARSSVPGSQWIAVLLDGPGWATRGTVGDRDAVPRTVLGGTMGWAHVERIWLPGWLRDQHNVVTRIVAAAAAANRSSSTPEAALQEGVAGSSGTPALQSRVDTQLAQIPPRPAIDSPEVSLRASGQASVREGTPTRERVSGGEWFVPASEALIGDRELLDRLAERRVAEHVRANVLEVIETEAPVEAGRLARVVAHRFDLQRVAASRTESILRLVPRGLVRRSALGTFVWQESVDPATYSGFRRTPAGVDRPIAEIAPEEIQNAMVYIATVGHGVLRDELLRETAALFNLRRLTEGTRTRLERVLERACSLGVLRDDGVRVQSTPTPGSNGEVLENGAQGWP
jgi:hypothetical protein